MHSGHKRLTHPVGELQERRDVCTERQLCVEESSEALRGHAAFRQFRLPGRFTSMIGQDQRRVLKIRKRLFDPRNRISLPEPSSRSSDDATLIHPPEEERKLRGLVNAEEE